MNYADKAEEITIDKTTYRVTRVYSGEVELAQAVEDIIIRKLLKDDDNGD